MKPLASGAGRCVRNGDTEEKWGRCNSRKKLSFECEHFTQKKEGGRSGAFLEVENVYAKASF